MRHYLIALLLLAGCKSKLDKCNSACEQVTREKLGACSDDACRKETGEWLSACKDLCTTIAGKPPTPDADEALCQSGNAEACKRIAGAYLLGRGGLAKDDTKAAVYFGKSCDAGLAFSCEMMGKMLRDGRGVARDPAKATALLTKACDSNSMGACTSLGLDAMSHDRALGVRLLSKACDGDDKLGCMGLGGIYLHGNGVKRDPRRAKTILQKACTLGAQPACDKVRTL